MSADKAGVGAVSTAELHGAKLRPHQTPAHSRAPEHSSLLVLDSSLDSERAELLRQEPLSCPAGSGVKGLQPRSAQLPGDELCSAAGGGGHPNLSERNLNQPHSP